MSNSQPNKLKLGIENGTKVTNDETNFPHRLLLTNPQVLRLYEAFANNSSANVSFLKTQLHKIGQSGGFLGRFFVPLINIGLLLMKNLQLFKRKFLDQVSQH